jgi:hypothetical protein
MQIDLSLPQVQQALITVAGSLLGALVAGFLTARWAVQKLRRERAFDRRLDWLEKVLRMLIDTRLALDAAVFSEQHDELMEGRSVAWADFQRRIEELWPVLHACAAYGTARMVAEISVLGIKIKEGQKALSHVFDADQQAYVGAFVRYMSDAAVLLRGLEGQVQAQLRHHLGLEMFGPDEVKRAEQRATARLEGRLTNDPLLPLKIVGRAFPKGFHKPTGEPPDIVPDLANDGDHGDPVK